MDTPRLVVGAGLDRGVSMDDSERLAEWLGAGYEPFAAHSHFGLVVGENSFQQVADRSAVPRDEPALGRHR